MTDAVALQIPASIPLSERGPASACVTVTFGFWLYLISDIIIFGALFAAYAVLSTAIDGGPSGKELFDRPHVFLETACLLLSSISCGFMAICVERRMKGGVYGWAAVTFLLGVTFLALETSELHSMILAGAGPQRSAFLSGFFALVGAHGAHVTAGILWLVIMMAQVATLGLSDMVIRRLLCFSLFWHALDIVWVGVFSIVYLGAR